MNALEKLPKRIKSHGQIYSPEIIWNNESKWWVARMMPLELGQPYAHAVGATVEEAVAKLLEKL